MSNSCSNQHHNQKGDAKNQNNESCQKNSQNQANQCNANHEHKNDKKYRVRELKEGVSVPKIKVAFH
ncbi:hypothetical protein N197_00860 [Helicobacter pylori UM023]|nr:hypothetical protein [Helicobacter pylori]EPZ67705.1 hypothetical protein N197_00860 [Helicobacter pylori UM023]